MAITLDAIAIKHERRVRLLFSQALGAGAFTAISFYTVTNQDGKAASPGVQKALALAGSTNAVELQLDSDLVGGAVYRFSAVGVPGADLSTTPNPSELDATFGESTLAPLVTKSGVTDLEALLYGKDILFVGGDFQETPAGDLAGVDGFACARNDAWTKALSNGLPWAPGFGLHAREYVDGAREPLGALRGRAVQQFSDDDRIASVKVTLADEDEDARSDAFLMIDLTPIGALGVAAQAISVKVPVSG